jgi:hypothetical protein
VSLKIECVVDVGMDTEKALGGSGRFEPLHLALSSAHGLMGVLRAIVLLEPLLMGAGQTKVPKRCSVGGELVGDQQFRREAQFPETRPMNWRLVQLRAVAHTHCGQKAQRFP